MVTQIHDDLTFRALADETRRRILQLLCKHELTVSELVACLEQPQSTVSRHLKILRESRLIHDRRDGTNVLYSGVQSNGDAERHSLAHRLRDWLAADELPMPLGGRLDHVLTARRSSSGDFFSRLGRQWDKLRVDTFGDAFHLEALMSLLPAEWCVADVGAGTGYMLPALSASFRKVIAVEPVSEMLDVARARCASANLKNVVLRQGDLGHLPIKDETVDLALAVLVLHHVESPERGLAELARVVRPGGQVLIVEYGEHDDDAFHERMQDRWRGFKPRTLGQWIRRAGFTNNRYRPLTGECAAHRAYDVPDLYCLTAERADKPISNGHATSRRPKRLRIDRPSNPGEPE